MVNTICSGLMGSVVITQRRCVDMIITWTPFRVSFCGGGSDIPSFYKKYGGCVLSTSIKKYMYLSLHDYFYKDKIILKYSCTEEVQNYDEIRHKYFQQCLRDFGIKGVAISSMADIPAGTWLGSSSAFTVGLLQLLHTYKGEYVSKYKLAKDACDIEINKLHQPIGKQDQFAAAFGGLKFYEFLPSGFVNVEPIIMNPESYKKLEDNILMFYIGGTHSASEILREQSNNYSEHDKVDAQISMCEIARELKEELQSNNVDALGPLMHENWILKKGLASNISNMAVDVIYDAAMSAGATGGKLLGAGGAGFMIFYVPEDKHEDVRHALSDLEEIKFELDNSGSSIIFID